MKLTIPLNLSRRLCDLTWFRLISQIRQPESSMSHNEALALLMRLWMFFCENRSGRIEDNEGNRQILAESLCLADPIAAATHIEKMIQAGVFQSLNGTLILTDYEDFQRDNATKGAHARAAGISVAAAKKNALSLLDYLHGRGVKSDHSPETRKRSYAILMALNTALGRKAMAHGEYTDALVSDVVQNVPSAITDDDVKKVCAWIRRYVNMDRRLKQSLPILITQHWHSIYESALKDEGPLG